VSQVRIPASAFIGYLSTLSAYRILREEDPGAPDPLAELNARFEELLGPKAGGGEEPTIVRLTNYWVVILEKGRGAGGETAEPAAAAAGGASASPGS
jgi:hypothetical protein